MSIQGAGEKRAANVAARFVTPKRMVTDSNEVQFPSPSRLAAVLSALR